MPTNFSEFLQMMDERQWFRMIVCFTPGLIVTKLSGYQSSESLLSTVGTVLLVAGVSLYFFWARIRAQPSAEEVEVEAEAPAVEEARVAPADYVSGPEQMSILSELRSLCGELERESDRLIAIEIQLNPNLSFSDAARTALARRKIQQQ